MGLFKATVHEMKENAREQSVVFEPTTRKKGKNVVRVREEDKPTAFQGMGDNAPFAMGLTEASRRFKRRFI